jgi:hypothetical protein
LWLGLGAVAVIVIVAVLVLLSNPITITGTETTTSQTSVIVDDDDEESASEFTSAADEADEIALVETNPPEPGQTDTPEPTDTYLPPTNTVPPTATLSPTETPPPPTEMAVLIETQIIGQSVNNRDIEAVRFGNGPNVVIFIGGLHAGAAPSSVVLANRAVSHFTNNLADVPANVTL